MSNEMAKLTGHHQNFPTFLPISESRYASMINAMKFCHSKKIITNPLDKNKIFLYVSINRNSVAV
jgi:hypothetical protein